MCQKAYVYAGDGVIILVEVNVDAATGRGAAGFERSRRERGAGRRERWRRWRGAGWRERWCRWRGAGWRERRRRRWNGCKARQQKGVVTGCRGVSGGSLMSVFIGPQIAWLQRFGKLLYCKKFRAHKPAGKIP